MENANKVSTTFRQAQPDTQVVETTKPVSKAKSTVSVAEVETPVALYQELRGTPYTAEHFGVKEIWDSEDLGMRDEVQAIEDAYRTQVQEGKLQDGKDSYKKFIKEAEKVTSSENAPNHIRIAKISEYLKFMNNLKRIDKNAYRYGKS